MQGPPRVLLIGMMGVGKSSCGRALSRRLDWPYYDSDEMVRRATGKTVPEIFADAGEAAFRAEESRVLAEAATSAGPAVVGVAGGAPLQADNQAIIRRAGLVVWLRADVETIIQRVGDGAGRPLLQPDPATAIRSLEPRRRAVYEQLADVVVDVDRPPGRRIDAVTNELEGIVRRWREERSG